MTEQAVTKSSEVGRVMTEEEYEEWKKEKEGGRQSEEDTGIDWGMGEKQFVCVFKRECPRRPREITTMWHMPEKLISLIFCSEIPHNELINMVYLFCSDLLLFSKKIGKIVHVANRYKNFRMNFIF